MISFPNAKINLGLQVTEKRQDGFHNIETIFYPVELSDILEWIENNVNKSSEIIFQNTGSIIDGSIQDNLCIKAYKLISKDFNLPILKIHLHKIIPLGAGLGGGSSNAAFMIKSLNNYFKLGLTSDNMIHYAQKLGSDCAFFIENKPVFAYKRGECFKKINLNLKKYFITIIHPGIHINTKQAYSEIIPRNPKHSLKELIKLPVTQWKENIFNDFEENVFKCHPKIADVKQNVYKQGAIYASMSGSGSAVYGIFKRNPEAIEKLFPDYFVWTGQF